MGILISRRSPVWLGIALLGAVACMPFPALNAQKPGTKAAPAPIKRAPAKSPPEVEKPEEAVPEEIPGQPTQTRRLIMKDGSYQSTVRWEIHGDRVRYLSAERYQWEELPREIVDWKATEEYGQKPSEPKISSEAIQAAQEEERKEKAELDASNPEVAPGMRLPNGGGVYLLDVYRGEPELVELVQNGGTINANRSRNVLRAAINPLAKNKQTIELPELKARIQAHVPDPVIYLNIDGDREADAAPAPAKLSERFRIVRAQPQPKKKSRVVGTIEFAIYSGTAQKQDSIETTVVSAGSSWIKVMPAQPLSPGEYAVVEMLGKGVNLYVWDFGINPIAQKNPAAWTPDPPPNGKDGKPETPELKIPEKSKNK